MIRVKTGRNFNIDDKFCQNNTVPPTIILKNFLETEKFLLNNGEVDTLNVLYKLKVRSCKRKT